MKIEYSTMIKQSIYLALVITLLLIPSLACGLTPTPAYVPATLAPTRVPPTPSLTQVHPTLTNTLTPTLANSTVPAKTIPPDNFWGSNRPDSGIIEVLAIDPAAPSSLYAGTESKGVMKSTDGGENWSVANTGLADTHVRALAIDPTTPTSLYIGTDGGVFKSTDGGGNWANSGLDNTRVQALAIDPSRPSSLYAGIEAAACSKAAMAADTGAQSTPA